MSIVKIEDCQWCTTTADLLKKWDQGNPTISAGNSVRGGPAVAPTDLVQLAATVPSQATYIAGGRFRINNIAGINNASSQQIRFMEGATTHVTVSVKLDGSIAVHRGLANQTQLGITATGLVQSNVYFHLEAKCTINDTTGSVEVRLNGSPTPILNLTNQDTNNGGGNNITRISFGSSSGITTHLHDVTINDTTGGVNDGFMGDVRVEQLPPNAAGNYSQWTPSAGSNFQNVDDTDPDDDTTYNETDVANEKDSYQHASLTSLVVEDIKGVVMHCVVKKSDAGSRTLRHGVRSNTTEEVSGFVALATGYEYRDRVYNTDPHTAAQWTKTNVDALESLVEVGNP